MKSFAKQFAVAFALFLATFFVLSAAQNQRIHWIQDYNQAVTLSQQTNKPILLLFTGTGWCTYCKKIEKEVFDDAQFANMASDKYIFVKMDFSPIGKAKNSSLSQQHESLAQKNQVQGFPTVLLMDSHEKVLLKTGYRQGGAAQYAAFLGQHSGT